MNIQKQLRRLLIEGGRMQNQDEIDAYLDKINQKGYVDTQTHKELGMLSTEAPWLQHREKALNFLRGVVGKNPKVMRDEGLIVMYDRERDFRLALKELEGNLVDVSVEPTLWDEVQENTGLDDQGISELFRYWMQEDFIYDIRNISKGKNR